jgi:hypothetical protein
MPAPPIVAVATTAPIPASSRCIGFNMLGCFPFLAIDPTGADDFTMPKAD